VAYPTVDFQPTSSFMGLQPINKTSDIQMHPLGTVIRARDVTYGEGEFIYLLGVASTATGDAVCYNSKTGVTVRAVAAGATSIGAFGIAMADTIAGLYGWYQISGAGPINAATTAANTQAFLTSTAGQIDDTGSGVVSGLTITAATSAGFATVQIDRPAVNPSDSGTNTGDVTLTAVGSTPAAAGASLSGQALTLQPADASHPGVVTAGTQTFGGVKTFQDNLKTGGLYLFSAGAAFGLSTSGSDLVLAGYTAGNIVLRSGESGAHFAVVSAAGVEVDVVGQSFILKSPDGTRWKLSVADTTGALTAVLA
jgi:hypothetical protein